MGGQVKLPKGKVLVTGGSGFIASHVIDAFLDDGFEVVATVRSDEKGRGLVDSIPLPQRNNISYVIVGDIAAEGDFDPVFKTGSAFDYVVHTASPYTLVVRDPIRDLLDPAIKGTVGVLKSVKANAPSVKRIVITSSSAAMINPRQHAKVYNETVWAPWTLEDIHNPKTAYETSKVLSEKAAWNFINTERPNFDLATINCTFTFGPLQRNLRSLDVMNTSNHRIRDMVQGKMKAGLSPTFPVFTFVDVRDVAKAHLRAITVPEAGGNRFYVVSGHFSNKQIADVTQKSFPKLASRLPESSQDDLPADVYQFDNTKSKEMLGMDYIDLEKSVKDTVQSILDRSPEL
ncbi:NAD(P)-binding protein [Rostrohypoxylon terebratum]|nr:NAD(P)-binding protein [Rostrohypoxylon terebratum]